MGDVEMQKRRRRTVPVTDYLALVAASGIVALSLISSGLLGQIFAYLPGGDKTAHAIAYAVLGFLALHGRRRLSTAILAGVAIMYFGGALELLQSEFGRTSDIGDVFANGLGVASAGICVSALKIVRRQRRRTPASRTAQPQASLASAA